MQLPEILAGPILRHVSTQQVVVWLVCSTAARVHWCLTVDNDETDTAGQPGGSGVFEPLHRECVQLGKHAYLHCLSLQPARELPVDCRIGYDIGIETGNSKDSDAKDSDTKDADTRAVRWLADTVPDLCYEGRETPFFFIKSRVDQVLHGSCRKPHFDGIDGLLAVDDLLAQADSVEAQPAMLLCTGDQVYTDDVAGPLLSAITQVIRLLGLHEESLPGYSDNFGSAALLQDPQYYHRSQLLPDAKSSSDACTVLFTGARKPIFTSISAENHLLTLSEVIAQYLLCWSPALWDHVNFTTPPESLSEKQLQSYQGHIPILQRFNAGLWRVRRAFAHIPTYMIFDDHDITDDWNISKDWEQSAYENPLARRVIGNALIGYFLCQGWGNAPERFDASIVDDLRSLYSGGSDGVQDALIDRLLKLETWDYVIDTSPRVVVLDTRTQRWFSEITPKWPSGLMDWESLAEAQQNLVGQPAVILVSSAPIFGVKLIEVIQRVMTWFSLALMVDAENWMAHPGSASAILNIFRHRRTPQNFVILSGDVHYAFTFDVLLRRVENGPKIWQITSSGLLNSFPSRLLRIFDRLNRWLFASRSPLNWLTRRRRMRIRQRRPGNYSERYRHQRLVNGCGVGRVFLDAEGKPTRIEQVLATGEAVEFVAGYESDWVH